MVNKEPKRILALQRAMTVVEAIAASDDGLRLQDLAVQVGLTAGAVHHIVDTLAAGGWVERATGPVRYRLGSGLADLAGRRQLRRQQTVVHEEMIALHRRLGCGSVNLCEAVGQELLLTHVVDETRPDAAVPLAHSVLTPYTSAASVVHLAFWPEERAQAYRQERPFEVHGGPMWGSAERFEEAVAATRREGWIDLPFKEPGSLRIGLPLRGAGGGLIASLTLSAHRVDEPAVWRQRFVDEGRAACASIRERLEGAKP